MSDVNPNSLIVRCNTLADVPATLTGLALVGNIPLYGDGTNITWLDKPYKRPKIASIGNSINKLNVIDYTTGRMPAKSYISWIYAFSGGGFDRVNSIPHWPVAAPAYSGATAYYYGDMVSSGGINYFCIYKPVVGSESIAGIAVTDTTKWAPSSILTTNESMDILGNYGWSGGTAANILSSLPIVLGSYIGTPDIIYLTAIAENDFGNLAVSTSIDNTKKIIQQIKAAFPKCLIILASPSQSWGYSQSAQALSDYNTYRTWVLGYSATDIFIEKNDANALGDPTLGLPNYNNTGDNWGNPNAVNIHPNERGACIRAKSFVSQLSFLLGNSLDIPTANPTSSPSNIAGAKGGVFNPNPDLTLTTGAAQNTVGSITIGSIYWTKNTGNLAYDLQVNPTGVELDMSSTGVTPGDSTHIYNNYFYASNDAAEQTDANNVSATNVTDGFFTAHYKVKILDATNIATITMQISFGTIASHIVIVPFQFDNAFYAGLDGALAAGDELTISTWPFTLRDKNSFMGLTCKVTMLATAAAAAGPKVEIQRMQIVKI